jgi:preprotein translocase subunit SecG
MTDEKSILNTFGIILSFLFVLLEIILNISIYRNQNKKSIEKISELV